MTSQLFLFYLQIIIVLAKFPVLISLFHFIFSFSINKRQLQLLQYILDNFMYDDGIENHTFRILKYPGIP